MTQEEKQPLLKDLFARVLYGVKVCFDDIKETTLSLNELRYLGYKHVIKPYLRSLSSMTEEEKKEFEDICTSIAKDRAHFVMEGSIDSNYIFEKIDWLNSHHFDYRGLIEKGLALEAPEGMYDTK